MKNILFLFTEIRTQLFIGKLTLAAILVLSVIAQVSAQGNSAPIDIREFSFTPSTIDTTSSSQTVTVTIRVTSAERDVERIVVPFQSVDYRYSYAILTSQHRISGNARDGVYRAPANFPQYATAGIWRVYQISVFDGVNYKYFSSTVLAARGFATQLQVINNNEAIPPEISDFSFTPSAIDTTSGSRDVSITVRATDAIAGVRSIRVTFLHTGFCDEEYNCEYYDQYNVFITSANRISGDDKDGVYKVVYTIPQNAPLGIYYVYVTAYDAFENSKIIDPDEVAARGYPYRLRIKSATAAARPTLFDFDGDRRADVSVFRDGVWYLNQSMNGLTVIGLGFGTDKIVPADYDGDGKTDVAVYSNGTWYFRRGQLGFTEKAFGQAGDIPVPADYDGEGETDIAVFRPSNGTWYILNLSINQVTGFAFGQMGDIPVAADYDGDGKDDIAVFRNGTWYIQRSRDGFTGVAFGQSGDKPVPADYDGDGKADIAVFRPENGVWYLLQSTAGFTGIAFGFGTDLPVPADYDGDGKADIAVFRDGTWYLQRSRDGFAVINFGLATDKPVPNAFVP